MLKNAHFLVSINIQNQQRSLRYTQNYPVFVKLFLFTGDTVPVRYEYKQQ